jgi:hypothetical protein
VSRDRSSLWIGLADLILCVLSVVIVAVSPTKAKIDGVKPKAEFLIQLDWDVTRDVDLDLWVVGPSRKPVFYGSRQVGCADLDRDSLGYNTSLITLDDGSTVRSKSNIETVSIRCLSPGHYDVAVNLFSYHGDSGSPITARAEITGLNPSVRTLWSRDVILTHLGETENVVSFDLDKDGHVKFVSVPLEPLTLAYEKAKAGGAP